MSNQYNRMPLIGDKFPSMTVQTTFGMRQLPDYYSNKWLILFSHPGDFTPVCTTEFVSFAMNINTFNELNAELIGLSVDQVQAHIKWTEWIENTLGHSIPFPIIADPLGTVASQLGMIHPTKQTAAVRAVFIIDPTSTIRLILYYPLEIGRSISEIIRALVALQVSDVSKVALPANWPDNELIGNQGIIPPPSTIPDIQEWSDKSSSYDWWFCYKPIDYTPPS